MEYDMLTRNIKTIFVKDKKCIVNADLDGILSGMLLQKFLNWKVVGYSSCCGKYDDDLWLLDGNQKLEQCVFVDLPVCSQAYFVIDQHFVAFTEGTIEKFIRQRNKINPNIMRKRIFKNKAGRCDYTSKYPFGTVHFILAVLENLGIINGDFSIDFRKKIESFELADLFLRADRVIGNTYQYTPNCLDWSDWLIEIGGKNTRELFQIVKNEYKLRKNVEPLVERKLKSLGCIGIDGDCSNLFRSKSYEQLKIYFEFLSNCLGFSSLPIFEIVSFNKLSGKRLTVERDNIDILETECDKKYMFSYAFVTMKTLSITYMEDK